MTLEQHIDNIYCWIKTKIMPFLIPQGPYTPGQVLGVLPNGKIGFLTLGTNPDPDPETFTAYWGWRDTNELPTLEQIQDLQSSGSFNNNTDITTNFSGANGVPKYLIMAEPIGQTAKARWYNTSLNNETISPTSVFDIKGTVGGMRVYMSTGQTDFATSVIFQLPIT